MAWNNLKQVIAEYVKANGNNEIEGDGLQAILKDMVDALGAYFGFVGVAVPTTTPVSSPDGFVFYLAGQDGLYSNFGAINLSSEIAVILWNGSSWQKVQVRSLSGGGGEQVQSDWDESDTEDPAYIKNKPHLTGSDDYFSNKLDEVTGFTGGAVRTVLSITVTREGMYQVNSSVTVDNSQSVTRQDIGVGIAVNGTKDIRATGIVPIASANCTLSKVLSLNAGDVVNLVAYSAGNFYLNAEVANIGTPCTFIDAIWLGN